MVGLAAFTMGLLFGIGLIWSGMNDPLKVQNFLDLAGNWDPTLAFVMVGALLVTMPAFALLRRRSTPLLVPRFAWPGSVVIDRRLLVGAALFGIGWGLSGLCPGPALVNLAGGGRDIIAFVLAMVAGMWLHDRLVARF